VLLQVCQHPCCMSDCKARHADVVGRLCWHGQGVLTQQQAVLILVAGCADMTARSQAVLTLYITWIFLTWHECRRDCRAVLSVQDCLAYVTAATTSLHAYSHADPAAAALSCVVPPAGQGG
jgi:hypothetical protein